MSKIGFLVCVGFLSCGCVLAPNRAQEESRRLEQAGEPFKQPLAKRSLPPLSAQPTWQEVLRRALLANGELEAAYQEWAMAVARVRQAGAWPNTPVSLGFEYMFSGERLKAWDRTTWTVGFDPMLTLSFPTKSYQSAKIAWRGAQAAGERFIAAKFTLQQKVLNAWYAYALTAENIRIQQEIVTLLELKQHSVEASLRSGGSQQDLLKAQVERSLADNQLKTLESELHRQRASLNAVLARPSDAVLEPPAVFPSPRPVPVDNATLLAIGVENNPELAALAREVTGREDTLERARMEYIPDFAPGLGWTGSIAQFVGLGITLPTVLPRIEGMILEARADIRRVEALARQTRSDRSGQFVATLYTLRNSERQAAFFRQDLLPLLERVVEQARQAYASGLGGYSDIIESQRMLLDSRLLVVEAAAVREKSLVDLEALSGRDIETLTSGGFDNPKPSEAGDQP